MSLSKLLDIWEAELELIDNNRKKSFNPEEAYKVARDILRKLEFESLPLDRLVDSIAKRWYPSPHRNPYFRRYGLVISCIVNKISKSDSVIVVPLSRIERYVKKKIGQEVFKETTDEVTTHRLDYLGFRNCKGTVIYDGSSRFAFGHKSRAHLILNGEGGDDAGRKQQQGTLVVLGKTGARANKEQTGGIGLFCKDSGKFTNLDKRGGTTYVLGRMGIGTAKNMTGGCLFGLKGARSHYGDGLKGNAKVFLAGKLGEYRGINRTGGDIKICAVLIPQKANILYSTTLNLLRKERIKPYSAK